jgi:hypothetical protein
MKQPPSGTMLSFCLLLVIASGSAAKAQTSAAVNEEQSPAAQGTADILKAVDRLVEQNRQLERQNQQLLEQIDVLRQKLAATPAPSERPLSGAAGATRAADDATPQVQQQSEDKQAVEGLEPLKNETGAQKYGWGTYAPNVGYKIADTEYGDLSISIYTYARYLNQLGLKGSYTNAFGDTNAVQRRQDFQLNKVQIKFLGWVMSPKFRYFIYAWTSNAAGVGAQTVLAGNLNYTFSKYFTLGLGITSLPGTRSTEGNFPYWLSVDSRLIADEFFRPSYTTGIYARGQITDKLRYQAMIGNNLSQLGVAAAQLDHHFNTFASALVWTPTTGEFGAGYGDFEDHQKLALRLAAHFTRSLEDKQSQPSTQSIENTQLRLSDGSIIFTPNLFGPGISINEANYKMTNVDAGIKYHGVSLDGTYYWRWLNHFHGTGTAVLPAVFNHGFEIQTSMMLIPKTLQVYAGTSKIFGQYGNPWDSRFGVNIFPWKNKVVRWNNEGLYLSNSPVGYTSVPFALGGKGFVFNSTFELAF